MSKTTVVLPPTEPGTIRVGRGTVSHITREVAL
jgi:hypothetical protein